MNIYVQIRVTIFNILYVMPSCVYLQPVLQRHQVEEMTADSIMKRLPNFPRSKQQEARGQIEALLKAMNYATHSASLEVGFKFQDL